MEPLKTFPFFWRGRAGDSYDIFWMRLVTSRRWGWGGGVTNFGVEGLKDRFNVQVVSLGAVFAPAIRQTALMLGLSIILTLFLAACSGGNENVQTNTISADSAKHELVDNIKAPGRDTGFIESDIFEIANLDYQGGWLQRIFVAIHPGSVNDTAMIRQAICILKNHYPLGSKSNISFFSDKKYANYKDILFMHSKSPLPQSEYKNWMESYYLGEYEFETNRYHTFPGSYKAGKQKEYTLNSCY